jgi:hypothetical protein
MRISEYEAQLSRQSKIVCRKLMASGLFQKLTDFYDGCPEVQCRAVLSNGDFVYVQLDEGYTSMRILWPYNHNICFSEFYWTKPHRPFSGVATKLAPHAERIIEWCQDYLNGKRVWRLNSDRYPGLARFHGASIAGAIKEAMLEGTGNLFLSPEEFQNRVLSTIEDGSRWTYADEKFSRLSDDEPPLTVSLIIRNPGDALEGVAQFADHTIVYAPEGPGRFFVYAIDDREGERICRTIVDGWLDDLAVSDYVPDLASRWDI